MYHFKYHKISFIPCNINGEKKDKKRIQTTNNTKVETVKIDQFIKAMAAWKTRRNKNENKKKRQPKADRPKTRLRKK